MAAMAAGVALHLHLQGDAAGRRISGEAAPVLLLGLLLLLQKPPETAVIAELPHIAARNSQIFRSSTQ
uniref:Uncharacterized protein n=1 Tax=Oryza meridionalis TaxID=40149 RepID=A0A0E0EGQ5_9ORYZ